MPLRRIHAIFESLGADIGERTVGAALAAFISLLPLVLVFAHRGLAPLAVLLGLVVALRAQVWQAGIGYFLLRPQLDRPLVRAGLSFLALCLWIVVTAFWSPSPTAWRLALNVLLPALAAGAVVFEVGRRDAQTLAPLGGALEAAFLLAAGLFLFEAASGGLLRALVPPADPSPGRIKDSISLARGMTGLCGITFAALYLMKARGRATLPLLAIFAAIAAAAMRFEVSANEAGLAVGAIAFLAATVRPRLVVGIMAALFAAALLLAPLAAFISVESAYGLAPDGAPVSWLQRLSIWKTAAREAIACLPIGCGAEYARDFADRAGDVIVPGASHPLPALPVHPHNLFIEIWLELGIPGALLFAAAFVEGARALLASSLPARALAVVAATAGFALVECLVELSVWQSWRLSAFGLAAAALALAIRLDDPRAQSALSDATPRG